MWGIDLNLPLRLLVVLLPIMLSTTIRNLKYLVPISSLANFLIISGYIAIICIICQDLPPISKRNYVADWKTFPMFFGSIIYSFEGINLVKCDFLSHNHKEKFMVIISNRIGSAVEKRNEKSEEL